LFETVFIGTILHPKDMSQKKVVNGPSNRQIPPMEFESNRRDFLGTATFVAFDTETTGLWAISNKLVEIAAVKFRLTAPECEEFQTLINPGRPIPREATEVHGITDTMVTSAPGAEAALRLFGEFCGADSILIAHNAPFDISFIGNEMERAGIALPDNPILDTVDIFRRYFPGQLSYSLLSLSKFFGLTKEQEHRGLSDAHLVRRLFTLASRKLSEISTVAELGTLATVITMSDWQAEKAELPSVYADLSAAVEQGASVEIHYSRSTSGESVRVIRPLQVHRQGGAHYIVAFCERSQAERTFRLDRIRKYRIL
jgi:DNA polymerase III epsilon subunit family exonuclease